MVNVKVNRKDYPVPTQWDEVTVDQYARTHDILKRPNTSKSQVLISVLTALTGIREIDLKSMTLPQFEAVHNHCKFFFDVKLPDPVPVDRFEFEGDLYMVPSDIGRATFGEFVDLDSELEEHRENMWHAIPGAIATYCRKAGEAYDNEYSENVFPARRDLFRKLPITVAEGLAAFFLTRELAYKGSTIQFSALRVEIVRRVQHLESSYKTMGGVQRLLHFPRTMFLRWIRSHLRRFDRYSDSLASL